jgi:hypothetical protein
MRARICGPLSVPRDSDSINKIQKQETQNITPAASLQYPQQLRTPRLAPELRGEAHPTGAARPAVALVPESAFGAVGTGALLPETVALAVGLSGDELLGTVGEAALEGVGAAAFGLETAAQFRLVLEVTSALTVAAALTSRAARAHARALRTLSPRKVLLQQFVHRNSIYVF